MHGDLKEGREGALWLWGRHFPDRGMSSAKAEGRGATWPGE